MAGASVIPFCVHDGQVLFLFHKTFSGSRAGCLVDFGGGAEPGESHRQTAMREFIEETETMYFSDNINTAKLSPERIQAQMRLLEVLFDKTLHDHPDWWCRRAKPRSGKLKDWKTFFVEFNYRDVTAMNREWELDGGARFSKRRALHWVPAGTLCEFYDHAPHKLWGRLRELQNVKEILQAINHFMTGDRKILAGNSNMD